MKRRLSRWRGLVLATGALAVAIPVVAVALSSGSPGSPQVARVLPSVDIADAGGSVQLPAAVADDVLVGSLKVAGRGGGFIVLAGVGVDPALPNCLVIVDLTSLVGGATVGCAPTSQTEPRVFTTSDGKGNRRGVVFVPGRTAELRPAQGGPASNNAAALATSTTTPEGRFFVVSATGLADATFTAIADSGKPMTVVIPSGVAP